MAFNIDRSDRPSLTTANPEEVLNYALHLDGLLDDADTDVGELSMTTGAAYKGIMSAMPLWGTLEKDEDGKVDGAVAEEMLAAMLDAAEALLPYADPAMVAGSWGGTVKDNPMVQRQQLLRMPPITRARIPAKTLLKAFAGLEKDPWTASSFLAFFQTGATGQGDKDVEVWRLALEKKPELALDVIELRLPFNALIGEELLPLTASKDGAIRSRAILATGLVGAAGRAPVSGLNNSSISRR